MRVLNKHKKHIKENYKKTENYVRTTNVTPNKFNKKIIRIKKPEKLQGFSHMMSNSQNSINDKVSSVPDLTRTNTEFKLDKVISKQEIIKHKLMRAKSRMTHKNSDNLEHNLSGGISNRLRQVKSETNIGKILN